jgi:hypothetical protein
MAFGMESFNLIWSKLERIERRMVWSGESGTSDHQLDSMGRRRRESPPSFGWNYWHEQMGRVERVREALELSGPTAKTLAAKRLSGIDLSTIWHILLEACKEIALYYGGSVVAGAALGGTGGVFLGGIGAIPGAGIGAAAGATVGTWIMAFLGLKSLVEELSKALPEAREYYQRGFWEAWGPTESTRRSDTLGINTPSGNPDHAAWEMANGHVIMVTAILTAIVAYLTRGKGNREALLQEIRQSRRLGQKVADWVAQNEGKLLTHPHFRPSSGAVTSSTTPGKPVFQQRVSGPLKTGPKEHGARQIPSDRPTRALFDRAKAESLLVERIGTNIKKNPLRVEYEQKVSALSIYADRIRPDMTTAELRDLAYEANEARRQLGIQYKNVTPEPLKDFIYEVNVTRYHDPLGPTVEYFVKKRGLDYEDIIRSASRPNPDIDVFLGKFGEWLKERPDSYVRRHADLIGN